MFQRIVKHCTELQDIEIEKQEGKKANTAMHYNIVIQFMQWWLVLHILGGYSKETPPPPGPHLPHPRSRLLLLLGHRYVHAQQMDKAVGEELGGQSQANACSN